MSRSNLSGHDGESKTCQRRKNGIEINPIHKLNQMKKIAIVGLVMLLNFVSFAQIPSDTTLRIQITSRSETSISGSVSNTQADILYEFQYKQNRTNWVSLGFNNGSEITNFITFDFPTNGLIPNTELINTKTFRVRSWIDSYNMGIPDWWQMRYFGNVGIEGYGNPMGDGWGNLQKFQNGMDPFKWYPPAGPQSQVTFQEGPDSHHANAILTWRCDSGLIADTFTIERAHQTRRGMTNYITFPQVRHTPDGKAVTNWPPRSLNVMYNSLATSPVWQPNNLVILGSYQAIAQMPGQPNLREYRYVDTNLNFFPPPVYRIQAHYPEPTSFAKLREVTATTISNTILSVTAKQQTNGYELTVRRPIALARYLLLVRDKYDRQWRASGYFVSGRNRNPVYLHVDKKGMMTDAQSPIALPAVKFLPDVVQPEFTAGWGEDSDGDGLPDIYELLVTHTKPDDADTDDTGILDGYRVFADDGWNNWQKFRCRVNPFKKCEPPPALVLKEPTLSEMIKAQLAKTDLPYELQIEIRTNATAYFQPYSLLLDGEYLPHGVNEHARCDVRVSWKTPPPKP